MVKLSPLQLVACVLLGSPGWSQALPLAGDETVSRNENQSPGILTARDILQPSLAGSESWEVGHFLPTSRLSATPPGIAATSLATEPSESFLWIYALSGCAAVGLVAFRVGGEEEQIPAATKRP